jgi:hypothetical protein
MPFPAEPGEIAVRGERVRVRADQIIVWVSPSLREILEQSPAVIPFPAILDTGHNHNFSIREQYLVNWAGIRPEALPLRGYTRDRQQRVDLRHANLWAHGNESGSRENLAEVPPFLLRARTGIAISTAGDFPRLPLLGLRVIAETGLVLKVDGPKRHTTLRTPLKWWPFG